MKHIQRLHQPKELLDEFDLIYEEENKIVQETLNKMFLEMDEKNNDVPKSTEDNIENP